MIVEYYVQLVDFWVSKLVAKDCKYEIESKKNDNVININILLDQANIGKVIGKNGKVITSLRHLITSISHKDKLIVNLKVIEK